MDREDQKRAVAEAALAYVEPGTVIGVGAGSTAEHFIRALARTEHPVRAAVAASERTQALLESHGIPVVGLSEQLLPLGLYVDGADEADADLRLVKGSGGALTREKVIATAARRFVCIVDESKLVRSLGGTPLPVEVVPMALYPAMRELAAHGGEPTLREGFVTDNGNLIVDVAGLDFSDPKALEAALDLIPGVVECGLFACRPADVLLVGTDGGVRTLQR
jgi:ribose 5-phosphate isomerase A